MTGCTYHIVSSDIFLVVWALPVRSDGPLWQVLTVCFADFYAISEQTMDYSLSYYLRMSWHDADLEFNPSENLGREEIILEPRDIVGELLLILHLLSTPLAPLCPSDVDLGTSLI